MRLVLLTRGHPAAYGALGLVDWLGPMTPEEAREAYLTEFPEQRNAFRCRGAEFAAWVVAKGIAEEVPCSELHVETLGDVDGWWERALRRCDKP